MTIHNMTAVGRFDNNTALASYALHAKIPDKWSVPVTALFIHPAADSNARTKAIAKRLPASVVAGDYLVAFRPRQWKHAQAKFKLLGITSC